MVFSTGSVSGGHFNPAVTLGVFLCERGPLDWHTPTAYVLVQLLASVVAGACYFWILGATFTLQPGVGYTSVDAAAVEVLFTAALVFVVLSVALSEQDKHNHYYGLAIGLTVMAAAFAIGPISGCSLNPAVTFGVMMSNFLHTGFISPIILMAYSVAPIMGAAL